MTDSSIKNTLLATLLVALGFLSLAPTCLADTSQQRPNIIFIFTDDQRADAIGYAGNPIVQTPTLDQLAQRGVIFDNAFVNTSVCAISRANVITGQDPRGHGVTDFFAVLKPEQLQQSYPALLRQAGYYTGFIGKWGIGHTHANTYLAADLFDYWAGGAGQMNYWYDADSAFVRHSGRDNYTAAEVAELDKHQAEQTGMPHPLHLDTQIFPMKVNEFLQQRDPNKPFMLSLFYKAPHGPWEGADTRYNSLYNEARFPTPPSMAPNALDDKADFLKNDQTMLGASTGRDWATHPDRRGEVLKQYYRLITGLDDSVAQLVTLLQQQGLAENTVILFTSDNGFLFGEHAMAGKWLMREPSIRVPGFLYDPRLPASTRGQHLQQAILTTDFTATILDLAGIQTPEYIQGASVLPLLQPSQNPPWRERWFYIHPYTHGGQLPYTVGVRSEQFKYTRYHNLTPVVEEFFDLKNDPDELHNLIDNPAYTQMIEEYRAQTLAEMKALPTAKAELPAEPHTAPKKFTALLIALGLGVMMLIFGARWQRRRNASR